MRSARPRTGRLEANRDTLPSHETKQKNYGTWNCLVRQPAVESPRHRAGVQALRTSGMKLGGML